MSDQRRPYRLLRAAALTLGAGIAFFMQLVAVTAVGIEWAGAYDVMHGDCGWEGTCSQAGSLPLTLWCALVLGGAELAAGLVLRSAARFAVAIMIGCTVSWAMALQDNVVYQLAAARYPGVLGTQRQGTFFFDWNARLLLAETALALAGWLVVAQLRRRARTTLR